MYKFVIICLLYISILQDATGSTPQKLFKRQTLIENKKNIGEGVENWAIVGDIPTPTLGRVRPSNEPERYRQQIQQSTERRNDRIRLNKRWIRDGNIDRFGTRSGVHGDRHWEERRNYRNRDRSSEEDRSRGRNHGTRDGEGRRYKRGTTKSLQDDALLPIKLHKNDELATEIAANHNNRKYDQYNGGYRRGYDRYGRRYGGRRYPEDDYERSEERIIITRHEVSADQPYYYLLQRKNYLQKQEP